MNINNIALSSNSKGFSFNATVIASILRRTKHNTWIKFYCQDFLPKSFERGLLKVEFCQAEEQCTGRYPGHVGSAVFDRLRVIRDATEWDRCLIMDHDMLALCDLVPYFEEDFDGRLLMGRMFGPGNTLGLQMMSRGGLPEPLGYAAEYPYFYMGPMMNLAGMRREGVWDKLLAAHLALGQDEQMALTIATEGKVKGVGRKWNLVPHWDRLEDGPEGPERSSHGTAGDAAPWRDGLPRGIIHWTGWAKPWHPYSSVWRPDLWESEETSWEALRNGWWEKPLAVEVEPEGFKNVNQLARRGWKVLVAHPRPAKAEATSDEAETSGTTLASSVHASFPVPPDETLYRPFPDVEVIAHPEDDPPLMELTPERRQRIESGGLFAGAEMARFGPRADVLRWLKGTAPPPPAIILQGPRPARTWKALQRKGYRRSTVIARRDWPGGGPSPSVLEYRTDALPASVAEEEDLYLLALSAVSGEMSAPTRGASHEERVCAGSR